MPNGMKYALQSVSVFFYVQRMSLQKNQITAYAVVSNTTSTLRCVIPVVCVTNEREENVVKQHN